MEKKEKMDRDDQEKMMDFIQKQVNYLNLVSVYLVY